MTESTGPGMPAFLYLDRFGRWIDDAFGHIPYMVGSATRSKTWRDVDVRLGLPDEGFAALFPGSHAGSLVDPLWSLLCAALSALATQQTGLPVDFQIQSQTHANKAYPDGRREPLGIVIHPEPDGAGS